MGTRSLKEDISVAGSIAPALIAATATGAAVDTLGFESATIVFIPGTITDGTHTPSVLESDDNSTFTTVAAGDLIGSLAALATGVIQRVGYRGMKRYLKAKSTVTGSPATGGSYGASVILGHPHTGAVS